ncbi:MAG: hypothetical protein HY742_03650 [Deltaproteobacteria bacterium]|nr:hypothetical protein [Deltaproteobacteria bacterium]
MDAPAFENLDLACAKVGKGIAEKPTDELHKVVTDALSVLEDQGPYALFLFLKTHSKKEMAKNVSQKLHDFLKENPKQHHLLPGNGDLLPALQEMAKDLDNLLLARDLIRQALVYARYHARLKNESKDGSEVEL